MLFHYVCSPILYLYMQRSRRRRHLQVNNVQYVINVVLQPVCKKAYALMHPQGRSHQIWSGQVSGACVSMQQLGWACPTRKLFEI